MGREGGVVGGKWRQLYLNNYKKKLSQTILSYTKKLYKKQ